MDVSGAELFGRAVFETIRQSIAIVDERTRVLGVNPAFRDLFQLGDPSPPDLDFAQLVGPAAGGSALIEALRSVIRGGAAVRDIEVSPALPGIDAKILHADVHRVRASDGSVVALVSLTDITEQRRAERERALYAQEVARSNRDLEDFAHAASHDLQEPLRKVRAFADRLVVSFADSELTDRQRDFLTRMAAAAARMQQRIDDLLGLARVSRSRPRAAPIELGDVVRDVLADMEGHIAEAGAEVDVGPLPSLEADPAQLELVFQNLISNSLKYVRPGVPPRIVIRSSPVTSSTHPAGEYEIVVRDNGIGFDPQYASRIFRPFERLHGRDEFEGSGIGLSICRRVVELHGGRIDADARPGEGASFTIRLPAKANQEMT